MKIFEWDRHFTTGLDSVDAQHRRLVDLINAFGSSLIRAQPQDDASLQAIFGQLAEYADFHFADEERLMRESGIDARHRDGHRRHHLEFVAQLKSMWDSRAALADPGQTLHEFLSAWLAYHILGEDQEMARQIAAVRAGTPAAAAYEPAQDPEESGTPALLSAMGRLYHLLAAQNRALAQANATLEQRVTERTAELARSNQALGELNLRLAALSNTDGLLGIANRRHFDARLVAEWQRAARERQALALLMLDVDHFKRYNDAYGHQAGDECLKAVAGAAAGALKRPTDLLARYGGEELAVLLPNTDAQGALSISRDIVQALAALNIAHADSPVAPRVTVSVGAASVSPTPDGDPQSLLAAADRALYRAKETGRNRICADQRETATLP